DRLSPEDYARLDQDVRTPMGELLNEYQSLRKRMPNEPVREDMLNLIKIIRDEGLEGARQAWRSGAFLPAAVGAVLVPSMLSQRSEEQDSYLCFPRSLLGFSR